MISNINFIDLTGSESNDSDADKTATDEGISINKSLSYLHQVIQEMSTNASHNSYRNSWWEDPIHPTYDMILLT